MLPPKIYCSTVGSLRGLETSGYGLQVYLVPLGSEFVR